MVDPPKTDAEKAEKKEKSFADSEQQPVGEPKKIGEAQYTFYLCDTLNYLNKHKEQKITHTLHVGDEVQLSSSSKESQGVGWFVVSIFRRYNTSVWHLLLLGTNTPNNCDNLRAFPSTHVPSITHTETEFPVEEFKKMRDEYFKMRCSPTEVKTEVPSPIKKEKPDTPKQPTRIAPARQAIDLDEKTERLEMVITELAARLAEANGMLAESRNLLSEVRKMHSLAEQREKDIWERSMDLLRRPSPT